MKIVRNIDEPNKTNKSNQIFFVSISAENYGKYRAAYFNCPNLFLPLLLILIISLTINAQQTTTSVGGATPSGLARDFSPGSIESISMFNGSVSAAVPLLNVGGRGNVGYTIYKPIKMPQWIVQSTPVNVCGPSGTVCIIYQSGASISQIGNEVKPDYEPGIIEVRRIGTTWQESNNGSPEFFARTQTVVVFVRNDGSEQTLYDERRGGNVADFYDAGGYDPDRGRIFTAKDGSELTFIADETIYDWNNMASFRSYESGYLKTKDGLVYRILNGHVQWMRDRNGNLMTFNYVNYRLNKVTDSNGRQVTFVYGNQYDQIIYDGTGGADRVIQINYSTVGNRFLPSPTYTYGANLFPQMNQHGSSGAFAPLTRGVVSTITLPNNTSFGFYYNEYGEISRFQTPGGAAVEYSYGVGDDAPSPHYASGQVGNVCTNVCGAPTIYIYRRIKQRREYANGGSVVTLKTNYDSENYTLKATETQINPTNENILAKTHHYFNGTPTYGLSLTQPMDSIPDYPLEDREIKTEHLNVANNAVLIRTEYEWNVGCWSGRVYCIADYAPWSPYLKSSTTSILDAETNQYKVAKTVFNYDQYNNQVDAYEYDYGDNQPGQLLRRKHVSYVTDTNYIDTMGPHLVSLPLQNWVSSDAGGNNKAALTQFEYDNYNTDSNHSGLAARSNVVGHDVSNYNSNFTRRGNSTSATSYANAQNQTEPVSVYSQYDILGNIVKTIDAKSNFTTIDYSDNFGSPDGEARANSAPSQLNGQNTFAFIKSTTNPMNWTPYTQYDYFTGLPVDAENINGVVTTNFYNDSLERLKQTIVANNVPSLKRQTTLNYDDVSRIVTATSDLFVLNDNLAKTERFADGLGRTVEERDYETGGYTVTDTVYDALGNAAKVTNPYRPYLNEAQFWTKTEFDSIGRIMKITAPDNTEVIYSYAGNAIVITDQALKKRRKIINALGKITRVDEPNDAGQLDSGGLPAQSTVYTYDALANLTLVQQGAQARVFQYNSLSQLKQATSPEMGTTSTNGTIYYTYDANGNLQTRRDARGVKTIFDYDAVNRVIKKCYRVIGSGALGATNCAAAVNETAEPNTKDATYVYDNLTNAKGNLTKVITGSEQNPFSVTEYTAFDELGRILSSRQTTDGAAYPEMTYTYNLSGTLIEQTYPSGRVSRNALDADGDLSIVQSRKDSNHGFWNYAQHFSYTASSTVSALQLGNGRWESAQFNSRQQPTQVALGSVKGATDKLKLEYIYGTLESGTVNPQKNNGNVAQQIITVPTETRGGSTYSGFVATQSYTYDSLNRIKQASETIPGQKGWQQTFIYDRYGNRRFDTANDNTTTLDASCTTALCNPEINPADNHLIGYQYDSAGNMTKDTQNRRFTYNSENKQVKVETVDSNNTVTGTVGEYFYNGSGKRVKKIGYANNQAVETTVFVYDAFGKLAAEYSTQVATVAEAKVHYLTNDFIGTPRIKTDRDGQVISRSDYYPFGEEIARKSYGTDNVRQKFSGYERDAETGLDYAQARMYANKLGRFHSPDPQFGNIKNPQSWNLYAYSVNNPITMIDPDGAKPIPGYVSAFVFANVRNVILTALKYNLSAGGIFAVVAWETGWGRSNAFVNGNNPGGLSGGSTKANFTFKTIEEGYEYFGKNFKEKFSDAIGIYDPGKFLAALVDDNGYKYNTDNKNYLKNVRDSILYGFGLDFFDECVLTPLRNGKKVEANGVTFDNAKELLEYMTSDDPEKKRLASKFLSGLHADWRTYVSTIAGTDRDRNVQEIEAAFSLPGQSNEVEEAIALYEYRLQLTLELAKQCKDDKAAGTCP